MEMGETSRRYEEKIQRNSYGGGGVGKQYRSQENESKWIDIELV